jgi:hypothetical protein
VLLQTLHDIIGYPVAFFFGKFLAKSADKLARASQRERDSSTCPHECAPSNENITRTIVNKVFSSR